MYRRIFFVTSATRPGSQPDKITCNDNENGIPNFFSLRNERVRNGAVRNTIDDNRLYVSWQTTQERNTRHFELQRSENGKDFKTIEVILAKGIPNNVSRYSTTDSNYRFCYDKLHYRLKVVFNNGKESFTDVIIFDPTTVPERSIYDLTYNRNQLLDNN